MSQAQHTPGPWSTGPAHVVARRSIDDKGRKVTSFVAEAICSTPFVEGEREANARLIAAAPELLAPAPEAADILEQYAEYIRSVKADELERHPYLPEIERVAAELRAAISKALGAQS